MIKRYMFCLPACHVTINRTSDNHEIFIYLFYWPTLLFNLKFQGLLQVNILGQEVQTSKRMQASLDFMQKWNDMELCILMWMFEYS